MRIATCAAALAAAIGVPAHAADHLFPTDLVAPGEVDASLAYERYAHEYGTPLDLEQDVQAETLQVRTGITDRLDAGARLEYFSEDRLTALSGNFLLTEDKGARNVGFSATYRLTDSKDIAVNGTAIIRVKAGDGGDSGAALRLDIGAGDRKGWRPYGSAKLNWTREDSARNSAAAEAGAFYPASERIRLKPFLAVAHEFDSSDDTNQASTEESVGLAGLFQIAERAVITAQLEYEHGERDFGFENTSFTTLHKALSVYVLFGK